MILICYVVEICLIGFFFDVLNPMSNFAGEKKPTLREKLPMLIAVGVMMVGFGIFTIFATIELISLLN